MPHALPARQAAVADGAGGLDPRRHAIRDNLADERLRHRVNRPAYAAPRRRAVAATIAPCKRAPAHEAVTETEFLFGEPVDVFAEADGWCWAQSAVDAYVGYVQAADIGPVQTPTHTVTVPSALVFAEPSIRAPVTQTLPMLAAVTVSATLTPRETFHETAFGFLIDQHVAGGRPAGGDWVAHAEQFVGAPYLWGGKTWRGLDCSGLIQIALQVAGHPAPRDSDMQAAELGAPLDLDPAGLVRGDLVFWPGHVGVMVDERRLLHANGFHMLTVVEPVSATLARLQAGGLAANAMRRLAARPAPA